jgi:hypothetical protein
MLYFYRAPGRVLSSYKQVARQDELETLDKIGNFKDCILCFGCLLLEKNLTGLGLPNLKVMFVCGCGLVCICVF